MRIGDRKAGNIGGQWECSIGPGRTHYGWDLAGGDPFVLTLSQSGIAELKLKGTSVLSYAIKKPKRIRQVAVGLFATALPANGSNNVRLTLTDPSASFYDAQDIAFGAEDNPGTYGVKDPPDNTVPNTIWVQKIKAPKEDSHHPKRKAYRVDVTGTVHFENLDAANDPKANQLIARIYIWTKDH
jgi:hypothetical protein